MNLNCGRPLSHIQRAMFLKWLLHKIQHNFRWVILRFKQKNVCLREFSNRALRKYYTFLNRSYTWGAPKYFCVLSWKWGFKTTIFSIYDINLRYISPANLDSAKMKNDNHILSSNLKRRRAMLFYLDTPKKWKILVDLYCRTSH